MTSRIFLPRIKYYCAHHRLVFFKMLKIKETKISVAMSRGSKYPWEWCGKFKETGSLQVYSKKHRRPIHLACYVNNSYLIRSNVKTPVRFPGAMRKEMEAWLYRANANFIPLDKPKEMKNQWLIKTINTTGSSRHRILIEILKFFSAREIGLILALVSKEFYHMSWSEELWRSVSEIQFKSERPKPTNAPWREQYLRAMTYCCVGCEAYMPPSKFRICTLVNLPLWTDCLNNHPKYKLVSIYNTTERFGITYNRVRFPTVLSEDNRLLTCTYLAEEAIKYARTRTKDSVVVDLIHLGVNRADWEAISRIDT